LDDIKRFARANLQVADHTPLQLYFSALVFTPDMTFLKQTFRDEIPPCLIREPNVTEQWSACLQILEGHTDMTTDVVFSPDGKLVASSSRDKTIRIWDTATGDLQHILEEHTKGILSVAFSPDGKLLASGSYDNTVRLWDTITGAVQQILDGHIGFVTLVTFSPNGKLVASVSSSGPIRLWDTATGAMQHILEHTIWVENIVFSPDSSLVARCSGKGNVNKIRIWDTATGAVKHTLEGHTASVTVVALSSDGKLLASGSYDGTVRLWDTSTGAVQQILEGHTTSVFSVAFSPDGKLVASGSSNDYVIFTRSDATVRLWDAAMGTLQHALEGHTDCIQTVVFSPDGKLLASGSRDKTIRLWDITTGTTQQILEHTDWVSGVAFSPDSSLVASYSDEGFTVRLWDTTIRAVQYVRKGHTDTITAVALSPDGKIVASGSQDKTVRLWDPVTRNVRQTLYGHTDEISDVAFSLDGMFLVSGSLDTTVGLWEIATANARHRLIGHTRKITAVVFSPDGKLVASGSEDHTVRLWDPVTGIALLRLDSFNYPVETMAFSPSSKVLACGNVGISLWNTATGAMEQILGTWGDVHAVTFSPDGSMVASVSSEIGASTWQIIFKLQHAATATVQQRVQLDDLVQSMNFADDGQYLETDRGALDVVSSHSTPASAAFPFKGHLFIEAEWISVKHQKLMWLPPEYRPTPMSDTRRRLVASAVRGNLVVIGTGTGHLIFIEVSVTRDSLGFAVK
jgi:WD40 repeat protein